MVSGVSVICMPLRCDVLYFDGLRSNRLHDHLMCVYTRWLRHGSGLLSMNKMYIIIISMSIVSDVRGLLNSYYLLQAI